MNPRADFARALLDPEQALPMGLKTWNGSHPAARFAVYRNNVVVSLIDALADSFPVTQALVGDAFFRAMARAYVQNHPPRSRLLATMGQGFPGFVESFTHAASVPYLPDVSRLEIARAQAYHAADAWPVEPEALQQALTDPDLLLSLRLDIHPSVSLVRSPFAIYSLWAAHQGAIDITEVDPSAPQNALVYRNGLDVETMELSEAVSLFICSLQQGHCLLEAVGTAASHGEFDLATAMGLLLRLQLITHIRTGEKNDHTH